LASSDTPMQSRILQLADPCQHSVVDLRDLAGTRTCLNLRFVTNCVMATVGSTVIP
jgi:hypothetical protein